MSRETTNNVLVDDCDKLQLFHRRSLENTCHPRNILSTTWSLKGQEEENSFSVFQLDFKKKKDDRELRDLLSPYIS